MGDRACLKNTLNINHGFFFLLNFLSKHSCLMFSKCFDCMSSSTPGTRRAMDAPVINNVLTKLAYLFDQVLKM